MYVKSANMRDLNENAMFQKLEETTNVHIDWQYAGDADWPEQKSLLLASGDLPDVFFGSNTLKDMDIMTNLDYFVPLEDYIDKYCTNLPVSYTHLDVYKRQAAQNTLEEQVEKSGGIEAFQQALKTAALQVSDGKIEFTGCQVEGVELLYDSE